MSELDLQHIQLPNNMTRNKRLTPNDLWVYICIKSFMNGKTKECFPSLKTIAERSEFSIPTVRESITALVSEKWMTVKKIGRAQKYYFTPYSNFEVFSYSFVRKRDVSSKEKAYLASSQQFMYKDTEGFGKISYTNDELAKKINLSATKIAKYDQDLTEKGYLALIESKKKDMDSGIYIKEKFFKLDELGQAVVFALQKHDEKIIEHDEMLFDLNAKVDNNNTWLTNKLLEKEKEIEELKKLLNKSDDIIC